MEFRGWDLETMKLRGRRVTIQLIGEKWYVMNGEACALRRQDAPDPIAFVYGLADATPSATSAEAYALLVEYLNQPINPYAWLRDNADPE
jgi:hypothetical protein